MPSSMLFVSLVVVWLLILVPSVARHRQEVARPSVAALSGRVLERSRRRQDQEVDVMDELDQPREVATGRGRGDERPRVPVTRVSGRAAPEDADWGDDEPDGWAEEPVDARPSGATRDRRGERPPPGYRPGRGGFDPEASALAARARYAFRQRVVLTMLVAALGTGVLAAAAIPWLWGPHSVVDLALVGYLVYLRRQVRMEEDIRERRAARMAGTRRPVEADDGGVQEWESDLGTPAPSDDLDGGPDPILGTGEPARTTAAREDRLSASESIDAEPALPRLQPAPPLPLPAGTVLVEADDDNPDRYELDEPAHPAHPGYPGYPGYRHATGR